MRIDPFDSKAPPNAHQHVILPGKRFTASTLRNRAFARRMQVANLQISLHVSLSLWSPSESGAEVGALSAVCFGKGVHGF